MPLAQKEEYEFIFELSSKASRSHTPALTQIKTPDNKVIFAFCFSVIELTNRPEYYRNIIFLVSSVSSS